MAGLGLKNRQLKPYQRVFRDFRQLSIPFNLVRPLRFIAAGSPSQELLLPLRRTQQSFLHISGPADHQTERLIRRLNPIQFGCRCR